MIFCLLAYKLTLSIKIIRSCLTFQDPRIFSDPNLIAQASGLPLERKELAGETDLSGTTTTSPMKPILRVSVTVSEGKAE